MVASAVMTHYDILGVNSTATAEQLRHAYRCAVKIAHPDAGGSPETFARVQQAWEQLRDPKRRASYDVDLNAPPLHQAPAPSRPPAGPAPRPPAARRPRPAASERQHGRVLIAVLTVAAVIAGSVTSWGVTQLGQVGILGAGIFLTASLGSLAARALGLNAGWGTYRLTQRAAWILAGALAALAGAFWLLDHDNVFVPAAGAACVASYAGCIARLWRIFGGTPRRVGSHS